MTVVSKFPKTRAARMLVFAVIGAPLGYLVGKSLAGLEDAGVWSAPDLGWSDVLAIFLAFLLLSMGVITMIISASRKTLGKQIDPEGARAATPAQAVFYGQQGLVMVLAGIMLGTPSIAAMIFDPLPALISAAVMSGIVALFLVQTAGNVALWFRSDEMMRRAISDTAALSFVILQGALFLWAAGEKLDLLPALTLWDAATVMMAAYLIIASVVTWRRGLAG